MKVLVTLSVFAILSISTLQAQVVEKKKNVQVEVKKLANPDIYVNGKKFDFPIQLINTEMIESISVIKGKAAIEKYNAKNGVLFITTKENLKSSKNLGVITDKIDEPTDVKPIKKGKVKEAIVIGGSSKNQPLIIIDGKKVDANAFKLITPEKIESISVFKGNVAMEKYNAPNGVIVVKTKKGKK